MAAILAASTRMSSSLEVHMKRICWERDNGMTVYKTANEKIPSLGLRIIHQYFKSRIVTQP
jgi:hypothetical protein